MMLETYVQFVEERHRIWEARQLGLPAPWTTDPTLATRKFTNMFRLLDPGSQYVLQHLQHPDPAVTAWRLWLYRNTNSVTAWEYAREQLGHTPLPTDDLAAVWGAYRAAGSKVFSMAYIIPASGMVKGSDKMANILASPMDWVPAFLAAPTPLTKLDVLRSLPRMGDFLAQQVLTDWGYLYGPDHENELVVPGPGSRRGAALVYPELSPVEAFHVAQQVLLQRPGCPRLPTGRTPSLMDVQNTFCEFSKYVRGPRATTYRPAHPGPQPEPLLPAHW